MQQLRKLQKLIIGMGEALLCYGAEISRVEETIQRVADHFQVEEVEMYVITNGLFVNVHQREEHTSTRLKYVPSISVNMKKLCDINELSRRIEQENLSVDTALRTLEQIRAAKNEPVWELVLSSGVAGGFFDDDSHAGLSRTRHLLHLLGLRGSLAHRQRRLFCRSCFRQTQNGPPYQPPQNGGGRCRRIACHDHLCDLTSDRCVGSFGSGHCRGNHSDDSRSGVYQRNP